MLADRVAKLETIVLLRGSHSSQDEGMCALEAVAWIAGEEHSDHPKCACPILSAFMRLWNDDLDEVDRQRLKPLIPRFVGTRFTSQVEQRRGWMAADWLVRIHAPAWLRLANLEDQAVALECLPELVDMVTLTGARSTIEAARDRADAARDAAWDAATKRLEPIKRSLQDSALDLLGRMIECR